MRRSLKEKGFDWAFGDVEKVLIAGLTTAAAIKAGLVAGAVGIGTEEGIRYGLKRHRKAKQKGLVASRPKLMRKPRLRRRIRMR